MELLLLSWVWTRCPLAGVHQDQGIESCWFSLAEEKSGHPLEEWLLENCDIGISTFSISSFIYIR